MALRTASRQGEAIDPVDRRCAGLSSLLDLLTDLWADEILSGRALTDGAESAHDGGNESGPPQRANATTAPDPQP